MYRSVVTKLLLFFVFCVVVGCTQKYDGNTTGVSSSTQPSRDVVAQITPDVIAPVISDPKSSLFASLPLHKIGDLVELEGYSIELDTVDFNAQARELSLALSVSNNSTQSIDLVWAIQLRDDHGGFVSLNDLSASTEPSELLANSNLSNTWVYAIPAGNALGTDSKNLQDYRLVFAPKGWSGPIAVFQIIP